MRSKQARYLGLDVGGTKCAAVLGTAGGRIIARTQWPSQAPRGPGAMIDELTVRGRALAPVDGLAGIGVSIGGPLDAPRGIIYSPPNLPGWDGIELGAILAEKFNLPVEKVRIEHDAAACALAEHRWGAGRSVRRLIYLTCGTGFGAGIVLDGQAYYGAAGRSAEFGHVRYRCDGPAAFGKTGSFEAFAAGSGIGRIAVWKYPSRRWTEDSSAPEPTGRQVAQWAEQGDAEARDVLRINARAVGHGAAVLADVFFPEVILLGSLARYLDKNWLRQVRQAFAEEALPDAVKLCRLRPAGLGARLGDLSSLAAALQPAAGGMAAA